MLANGGKGTVLQSGRPGYAIVAKPFASSCRRITSPASGLNSLSLLASRLNART